jgi:threonylcarbamoyladenosine tRNA methylthiotransferase MtaB
VVITGVLVGGYGSQTGSGGPDLAGLLRGVARVPGIERVRLSSIEPTQVTDELLDAFGDEAGIANHLHIPLQSGSSRVLAAMNRPYTQDDYVRLCDRAHRRLPDLAVTTDIMVGFPGEDRQAFEDTVRVAKQVGFARAHIFRYSPRPGTPAAAMPDAVSEDAKEARSHELAEVCRQTQQRYLARYLGRTLSVLVEGKTREGGLHSGYTENYIRVQFAGSAGWVGSLRPVRLLGASDDGAIGEMADAFQPEADIIPLTVMSGAAA